MEIKDKERRLVPILCGLLVLMACCFRTGAVLQEREPTVPQKEVAPFIYMPGDREEGRPTEIGETQGSTEYQIYETSAPSLLSSKPSQEDIDDRCGAEPDIEAILQKEISLSVSEEPCVLILHTHGTEAYADCAGYRSEDEGENVIRVGKEIAEALNAAGIPTIHDTTAYDMEAGYNAAYDRAAEAIAAYLDKYPGIQVVIDVHRDAASDGQGGQKPLWADLQGERAAAMMLVMGTDTPELPHENWEENLSFALKLQSYIEEGNPGIMRKISLRGARYNEHFTSCSILLEVGSAGNTMEEALRSGAYFGARLAEFLQSFS